MMATRRPCLPLKVCTNDNQTLQNWIAEQQTQSNMECIHRQNKKAKMTIIKKMMWTTWKRDS